MQPLDTVAGSDQSTVYIDNCRNTPIRYFHFLYVPSFSCNFLLFSTYIMFFLVFCVHVRMSCVNKVSTYLLSFTGDGLRGITVNESTDVSKSSYAVSRRAADTVNVLVEI